MDILSGGGSSDATAANQLVSQGKLDSIISNTASLGDTANRTLLTAQNQTNGNQITKCMGLFGATQVQLKVDTNGVLETSGGGGGGGSTQYNSASTLPNPTVGTAVLGVDSGGLANVISTDNTGKIENVIHGTNNSGVAFPASINQYTRAIAVKDAVSKSRFGGSVNISITANTALYKQPTGWSATGLRSVVIFGNSTNTTEPIYFAIAQTSSSNNASYPRYRTGDSVQPHYITGDFYKSFPNYSGEYISWEKANTTNVAETITVNCNGTP